MLLKTCYHNHMLSQPIISCNVMLIKTFPNAKPFYNINANPCLFGQTQANEHNGLGELFPNTTNYQYGLHNRRHNYTLNIKMVTDEQSFITRLLFKDMH